MAEEGCAGLDIVNAKIYRTGGHTPALHYVNLGMPLGKGREGREGKNMGNGGFFFLFYCFVSCRVSYYWGIVRLMGYIFSFKWSKKYKGWVMPFPMSPIQPPATRSTHYL